MIYLTDKATIDGKARITPEGYLVADALVAKGNNIQTYTAGSLKLADRDPTEIIRVFRPAAEVFAVDSLRSASRLPICMDHPSEFVDAKNWKDHAKGETGETVLRDGEFLRVPLRVTDAGAVQSVQDDRQEFSLGYGAEITMQDGEYEGEAYDAVASQFRYNHLAACKTARGGPELRITDERPAAPTNGVKTMKTVIVDGVPADVSNEDTAALLVGSLVQARDTAVSALEASQNQVADHAASIATKDAEISQLKDAAENNKITPAQLRDAAAEFSRDSAVAEALGVTVTDAMDGDALQKAVVDAKLGDSAKDYTQEQIGVAFATLAATATDEKGTPITDSLREAIIATPIATSATQEFTDAKTARFSRFNKNPRQQEA